jgi:hypothetical protein
LGPTRLEGLVSAVACRGYLVYAKIKLYFLNGNYFNMKGVVIFSV